MTEMNAAHFIYIPVCILIGIVFGWILGGRAARTPIWRSWRGVTNDGPRTKNEERQR